MRGEAGGKILKVLLFNAVLFLLWFFVTFRDYAREVRSSPFP